MHNILKNLKKFCSWNALSPLDGRYNKQTNQLQQYFSESALMKYRVRVQSEWLLHLVENDVIPLSKSISYEGLQNLLSNLWKKFDDDSAKRVKQIQAIINHDMKAIEYYIKEKITTHKEDVHFCCTSQDINNLAYSLMLTDAMNNVISPTLDKVHSELINKSEEYADHAMISRTHGQPATPTTLGKEFANFTYRIGKQIKFIKKVQLSGKINGAVGNYNAHYFAFPEVDWLKICQSFVREKLKLDHNEYTTQIQPHDSLSRLFGEVGLCNTITLGLCRDVWDYTSKGYLKQKSKSSEVGSSTMPHKVNPIDFENCEGNLGIANSMIQHFRSKLPISRLQRDLSDSTVMRNQGTILGYSLIGYKSLLKGLTKISANEELMIEELSNHYEITTQAIQTELRKTGYPEPYQLLKNLSRGHNFSQKTKKLLVEKIQQKLNKQSVEKINNLKPQQYLGKASHLAKNVRYK